jgi:Helicase conserved C-terminal domain
MELLEHQAKTIKYLVSRCKDQHGLLINHVQGSGKTNLGLFLKKNYPKSNLILFLPKGLNSVWVESAKRLKVKINHIFYYDELTPKIIDKKKALFKNAILIMDEAHHLIELLNSVTEEDTVDEEPREFNLDTGEYKKKKDKKIKSENKNALIEILSVFKTAKKVLMLSGTPIRTKLSDLRWFINIAAGKKVVPYNEIDFQNEYFGKNFVKGLLYDWVNVLMYVKNPINDEYLVDKKFRFNLEYIEQYQEKIKNVTGAVLGTYINSKIKNKMGMIDFLPGSVKSSLTEFLMKQGAGKYSPQIVNAGLFNNVKEAASKNILRQISNPSNLNAFFSGIIVLFIGYVVYKLLVFLKQKYVEDYDYERLDLNKIKVASPYISYYKYNDSENYPEVYYQDKTVNYTNYQLLLWIRTIIPDITDKESVDLEFNKNLKEAELFKPNIDTINYKYLDKGRKIGNLFGEDPVTNKVEIPNKFIQIGKMFKENDLPTIVYSNFANSLLDLSKYFKAINIKHTMFKEKMSIEEKIKIKQCFKDKKIKMLLLDPVYFQGFDIQGCRIFHILEPVSEYYKKEQVMARTVRYKSHVHLPVEERNVVIYQWKCSISNLFEYAKTHKKALNYWFNTDVTVSYFTKFAGLSDSMTSDDIVEKSNKVLTNKIEEFNSVMDKIKVDNSEIPLTCNIFGQKTNDKKLKSCI